MTSKTYSYSGLHPYQHHPVTDNFLNNTMVMHGNAVYTIYIYSYIQPRIQNT